MSDTLRALLTPFSSGMLPMPAAGRALLLRAEVDPALAGWRAELVCEQTFKPSFDALCDQGFVTVAQADGTFDAVLVPATKHKAETQANLARGWEMLAPGGTLVFAGGKDLGGATLARELIKATEPAGSLSKYHCKVMWLNRSAPAPECFAGWAQAAIPRRVAATGYVARPGIFGWDKVDRGSALLVAALPADLGGRVADLGAGWGYIAAQLAGRAGVELELFEAEKLALDCARINVPGAVCHWADVAAGIPPRRFDWVVTNPPFHAGKAADVALGQAFIAAAASGLKPGGRLVLVANRHLPYEPVIDRLLTDRRVLAEDGAFKVILAGAG